MQPQLGAEVYKKKFYQRGWFWVIVTILVLFIIGSFIPSDSTDTADSTAQAEESVKDSAITTPASIEEPEPELTTSQENAIEQAESYLQFSAFSKKGLIDQLEYEKFSKEDAKFAVNYIEEDWNYQAVRSAHSYMESGSFSKQGLVDQLEYEKFTHIQAEHGADVAYQ